MRAGKRRPPEPAAAGEAADVCLVLEGTYPFVSGGVSSWVHQMVRKLDHLRFGLAHVSPRTGHFADGPRYDVPENVVWLQEIPLHETRVPGGGDEERARETVARYRAHVERISRGDASCFADLVHALDEDGGRTAWQVLQTPAGWRLLVDTYRAEAPEESFLDFFWTWRFAQIPLLAMSSVRLPEAGLYHSISTGYAGLLAAAAKVRSGRPMLLTEHGIYTKERRIEIERSTWIPDWEPDEIAARSRERYFHRFWARQFERLSHLCYQLADETLTLYGGNRDRQERDGLAPGTGGIVPNGIDLRVYGGAPRERRTRPEGELVIGFVGRVTPIKDVKTLLYAMRLVVDAFPGARLRIMGPKDEAPDYAAQCETLMRSLGLDGHVAFEGSVNVPQELPTLDVMVLTSISEAQPLVILEAGAAGVPVVATDVGSCRELLFGGDAESRRFGQGGFVTPIATPQATARALLELARDPALGPQLGENLRGRVERLYGQPRMIDAYRAIYARHLAPDAVEA